MPKFAPIEGLRAWLAWTVVLSHIGQSVDIRMLSHHWAWLDRAGHTAVLTFIAISGFVICNLVLARRETWPRYLIRRVLRIFPLYWVAFAAALAALPLGVIGAEHVAWAQSNGQGWDELLRSWQTTMNQHPWQQMLLHVTLLQGLVPDSLWPGTASAVLGPAWSLTLEWQFYVIAPAFIWLLSQQRWRLVTVLAVIALAAAFERGAFGAFALPSFLPGAGYIFMIGIACRLGFDSIERLALAPAALVGVALLGLLFPDLLWLAIWLALMGFLANEQRWKERREFLPQVLRAAFASRIAGYFGARSYAVYLCHLPLLEVAHWFLATRFNLTQAEMALALAGLLLPSTLIASELLHRAVELPMIRLGAQLAKAKTDA